MATTFAAAALGCGGGVICKGDGQSGLVALFVPVYQAIGGAIVVLAVAAVPSLRGRR